MERVKIESTLIELIHGCQIIISKYSPLQQVHDLWMSHAEASKPVMI